MVRTRMARISAAALALTLVAGACGGGRDDETSSGGGESGGGSGGTATSGGDGGSGDTGDGGSGDTGEAGGFAISTDDCDSYEPTKGVTDTEILIGSSFAQSGLYAAYADISKGWTAYFDYVNEEKGGVNGRKVTFVTKDDGYLDPNATKANVDGFVADDGVFAVFNVVGTPNNIAIRDDLGLECVPNLFAATGAQQMGEPELYPWTIGSIPAYATETAALVDYLKAEMPTAKIGVLKQNDDFGEGYAGPLAKAIEGTELTIVDQQTYNPGESDVKSQMTALRSAGADTVLIAASGLACPSSLQAVDGEAGWDPFVYLSATCASKTLIGVAGEAAVGAHSAIYLKEPANPEFADDPELAEFKTLGAKYGLSEDDLTNGTVLYGWIAGQMLEYVLDQDELTRQSVMEAAYSIDGLDLPLLFDGVTITTNGAADPFPIEAMRMSTWNGTHFDWLAEAVDFEGQTVDYVTND